MLTLIRTLEDENMRLLAVNKEMRLGPEGDAIHALEAREELLAGTVDQLSDEKAAHDRTEARALKAEAALKDTQDLLMAEREEHGRTSAELTSAEALVRDLRRAFGGRSR